MKQLLIMNNKGGCGKTTIATNLAGFYAASGTATALLDYDPQGSSNRWLEQRPESAPPIHQVFAAKRLNGAVTRSFAHRIPPQTQRVVIDTPASMKRLEMLEMIRKASTILVPMLPSAIDRHVTLEFLDELLTLCRQSGCSVPIGIIANRVRTNTRAYRQLIQNLEQINLPLVASLRDTQNYVRSSEQGLAVAELNCRSIETDRQQWWSLIQWLETDRFETSPHPKHLRKESGSAVEHEYLPQPG